MAQADNQEGSQECISTREHAHLKAEGLRQQSEGLQETSHCKDKGRCSLKEGSRLPQKEKSAPRGNKRKQDKCVKEKARGREMLQ